MDRFEMEKLLAGMSDTEIHELRYLLGLETHRRWVIRNAFDVTDSGTLRPIPRQVRTKLEDIAEEDSTNGT